MNFCACVYSCVCVCVLMCVCVFMCVSVLKNSVLTQHSHRFCHEYQEIERGSHIKNSLDLEDTNFLDKAKDQRREESSIAMLIHRYKKSLRFRRH